MFLLMLLPQEIYPFPQLIKKTEPAWFSVTMYSRAFSRNYSLYTAMRIYCIAILWVCDPGIKTYELKEAYDTSFLSDLYLGVALSKNTISTFLNNFGKALSKIAQFMCNRTAGISMDHNLLVDGTLKSDESKVNSLWDFSCKARTKGTRDIPVLYAFDLEEMEPICSKCFPENMLDATSYRELLSENRIIVGDKGFPESASHDHLEVN